MKKAMKRIMTTRNMKRKGRSYLRTLRKKKTHI
jgi:hypothetical protein